VLPLVLVALGAAFAAIGLLTLLSAGSAYRIGRTLSAAPSIALGDVAAAAEAGRPYVRVHGRIASDEEFPDDNDRPLVYRRRRLELAKDRRGRRWRTLEDEAYAVPFGLEQGGAHVAIEAADLDEGLIVIVREALGTASDAPDRVPPGTSPKAPLRHRIHQLSAVEHAYAAGRPTVRADGTPALARSSSRPLIVTPLEIPEAMRVLAEGRRWRIRAATFELGIGLGICVAGIIVAGLTALGVGGA
jgi:hypothetical protein